MINRDMKTVTVVTFTSTVDSYGIPQTEIATTRNIEMAIYDYSHRETDDIRYQEVDRIGITKDNDLTDENQIIDGSIKYNILYIQHPRRNNIVYLREVK